MWAVVIEIQFLYLISPTVTPVISIPRVTE